MSGAEQETTQESAQEAKPIPAGWAWPVNLNRAHWFPGGTLHSICGKAMLWVRGMLDDEAAKDGYDGRPGQPGRDDCRACWRAITDPKWGRAPRTRPQLEESGSGRYGIFYRPGTAEPYRLVYRTAPGSSVWDSVMVCESRAQAIKASKADALMRAGMR